MKRSSTIDEFILDLTKYDGVIPQEIVHDLDSVHKYAFAKVYFDNYNKIVLIPLCIGTQAEADGVLHLSYFSYYDIIGDDFAGACLTINANTGEFSITEY